MEDQTTIPASGGTQSQGAAVDPATDAGKGNTEATTTWMDGLSEPLKASKSLARYSSVDDLAKSYVELERKLGGKSEIPGPDAKPEDWEKFYSLAGRPKAAGDYAIEPVEGFEPDPKFMTEFKERLFAAGISQSQASKIYAFLSEGASGGAAEQAREIEKATAAQDQMLHEAWGAKYDEKREQARRFVLKVGGESAIDHLEQAGATKDAIVMQLLAAAGEAVSPHRFVDGATPKGQKAAPYSYMNEGARA